MNSPMEDRLREALTEAGATVDTETLRPLRTPEKRSFRVDLRLVAALAVVVLVGVPAAVWLGGRGAEQSATLTGPSAAEPGLAEVRVFLCTKSAEADPVCKGRDATPDQVKSIEAAARRVPGVASVTYLDQAATYASFRRDLAANKAVLDTVTVEDLHASFRLLVGAGGDPETARLELQGLPGVVDTALVTGPASSPLPEPGERAEVSVFLCHAGSAVPACVPDGQKEGKEITKAQKEAVVALLRAAPEVKLFVFEDRETAFKNFKQSYRDNKALIAATRVEDMPESYRLRMRAGADWSGLVGALSRQRGVSSVVDHRCLTQTALLQYRYRLTLSGKVCPIDE